MQKYLTSRVPTSLVQFFAKPVYAAVLSTALGFAGLPAAGQGLFSPAITVNDAVITNYELEQRARFMGVLRAPGDPYENARRELIHDRLKMAAIQDAGIEPSKEDITAGMTELAGRANLSLNEFLTVLQQNGIEPETVRDFTQVGIGWREFLAARFLSRARPTEEEIDRAMGQAGSGGVQVLLSELIVPINEQNAQQVEQLAEQVTQIRSLDTFSAAASQYSASDSRSKGGRLPWMSLTKLPPQLQEVVLALKPGEVTEPMPLQGAVAFFQMRSIREVVGSEQRFAAIEYAAYYIPGGRSEAGLSAARALRQKVDTCDDLYGIAKDQDPAVLDRITLPPSEIPQDVAIELAKLDPGEVSTTLTRNNGQTLMFLMMCGRTTQLEDGQSRETVANALVQQRLASFEKSYLEQLKADARIVEK